MSKRVHVVPKGTQWVVKPEKHAPVSTHQTQHAAEQAARELLKKGGELITHGRDNLIRSSDTLAPAKDPFPPRDTEH